MIRLITIILLTPISLMFIAASCDDKSTEPGDDITNPNPIEWSVMGSQVFDGAGGEASFDNLDVKVDPGELKQSIKIDFAKSGSKWVFTEESVADLYQLKFDKMSSEEFTVHVTIGTKEDLTGVDGVQLMVGFEMPDKIMGIKDYNYYIIDDIKIESNKVSADLKLKLSEDYKNFKTGEQIQTANPLLLIPPAIAIGVAKYVYNKTSANGNFKVYGHWAFTDPPDEMLTTLESVYDELKGMGFDMTRWRNTKNWPWWPFRCYIYPQDSWTNLYMGMANNEYAFFRPNWVTRNFDYLAINSKYIKGSNTLKVNLGHEFFHAIQSVYNHEDAYTYRWLMEATSAWFETYLHSQRWAPVTYFNDPQFYKNGLNGVTAKSAANHGYPSYILIKHLADKFGKEIVYNIWKEVDEQPEGRYNAARAVANTVYLKYGVPFNEEYFDFIKDFIIGSINDFSLPTNDLVTLPNWEIKKADIESNKLFETTTSYPDFSAQVMRIKFNDDIKQSGSKLPFNIKLGTEDKMVKIFFFTIDDGDARSEIYELNEKQPEFAIEDARDYAGKTILAVIVNCNYSDDYNGKTSITVTNGINPMDGRFTWSVVPTSDACNIWSKDGESFVVRQKVTGKTITCYDEEDQEGISFDYELKDKSNFVMTITDDEGYTSTIVGKIIDNDHWESDITINDYNLDDKGNRIDCTSKGRLKGTRVK